MIKRYNYVQLRGQSYVNDPETLTLAPFPTVRGASDASLRLNSGDLTRDELRWIDEVPA